MKLTPHKRLITFTLVAFILVMTFIAAKLEVIDRVASIYYQEELPSGKNMTEYTMEVDFDAVEKIITGKQKVSYVNGSNTTLNTLYFHLYPNAFKNEDTTPFEKTEMEMAYPSGFEPGHIDIHNVRQDKTALNHVTLGKGNSILKVNLNRNLEPGQKVVLDMDFSVKVPPSYGRFGYGENTISMANWYPIASVFDHKGWNLEPYHAIGDPFYSDIANYRVSISMPKGYTVATTGNIIKKEDRDGKVLWTIEARAVRDFAMIASDRYKMVEDEINGVKIYSYYFDDEYADMALQTAKDSIEIFSEYFGTYPYKQFSVAAADFFIGGMEYPNLVFIDQQLYRGENKDILEYVIAHEAAHQWWYGIVGNDEVNEPWLDEALTEYSTLLYYEKKYGKEVKDNIFKNMIVRYYTAYRQNQPDGDDSVYRSIGKFKDSLEYQVLVYYKGAMFVEELRKQLGDEMFFKVMKVYYDKYKFRNADTEGFIKLCEQVSDQELRNSFAEWLRYKKE